MSTPIGTGVLLQPGNFTSALSEKPYTSGSGLQLLPTQLHYSWHDTPTRRSSVSRTPRRAILRLTLADNLVNNRICTLAWTSARPARLGLMASATGNATTDSTNLVNALSNIFMHGQMPAQMQADIVSHVATLTNIPERVRVATYLVITSSHYKVEH